MGIPTWCLVAVKDLLRRPASDTSIDTELESHYFDALKDIFYKHDWLVQKVPIDAIANQRTYSFFARTMRLLAILYNSIHLPKISARSLDYLRATWQSGTGADVAGTPEVWWTNQLPDPNVIPNEFGVHPIPSTFLYQGFTTYQTARPLNDDPIMLWVHPLLIYQVAALYLMDTHAHRDMTLGEFYKGIADMWEQVLDSRIQ